MAPIRSALPLLTLFLASTCTLSATAVNGTIVSEMIRTRPETAAVAENFRAQVEPVQSGALAKDTDAAGGESEDKIEAKDYNCNCRYYECDCDEDISTAVIVIIVVSILFFFIGITVLVCYCCACCCFIGRRTRTRGEVYQAQVIVPQQQPGYFYPPGQPGVSIVHNHQYQAPPAGTGAGPGAPGGVYPVQGQATADPVPPPGFYFNNGMQVQKSNANK